MDLHWPNVAAYAVQVTAVAVLGTLAALLVRIESARVRYMYWRMLLLLCLLLPWLQGRPERTAIEPPSGSFVISLVESSAPAAASGREALEWSVIVAALIVTGMVLQLLWMAVGLMRLRRLRLAGDQLEPPAHLETLQAAIGVRAAVRYVVGLRQPLTFGVRRPVILLPDRLRDQGLDVQRAVLCHELLHVKRRDWLWLLLEECVRAVLWFHPAIWWLIARVQLAREEAVDQLAVPMVGGRRTYIKALMAFADETPLAPAAAFARRHHLFRRIVLVSKEAAMSPRRVAFMCVLLAIVVLAGATVVVRAIPMTRSLPAALQAGGGAAGAQDVSGSLDQVANPVTPENPIPRRLAVATPEYPASFIGSGVVARVSVRMVLDASGAVADARVLSANVAGGARSSAVNASVDLEPFRAAALDAARRWLYAPPVDPPIAFTASFDFVENNTQALQAGELPVVRVTRPVAAATPGAGGGAARPGPAAPRAPGTPIRVGGNIRPPQLIRRVNPAYPPIAISARVQGVVILEVTVGTDGSASDVRILRSLPLLDQAAVDAVNQWQWAPTLLNGVPVPVIMVVTVQFTLPPEQPAN